MANYERRLCCYLLRDYKARKRLFKMFFLNSMDFTRCLILMKLDNGNIINLDVLEKID